MGCFFFRKGLTFFHGDRKYRRAFQSYGEEDGKPLRLPPYNTFPYRRDGF